MKVSVSLPAEDIEFLDDYAATNGMESRSAAVHKGVRLLRSSGLGAAYEQAWAEWATDDDSGDWEAVVGDGVAG
ncbi:MAG: ribbon-helix-helix domain-containing protein [Ilumatobacter sp.]|uniref:ribbon-helix-helix domain-containing protein n=1 Tax=Ilumatobacter sp. TaxID=1967498 RepID=UPI003296F17A